MNTSLRFFASLLAPLALVACGGIPDSTGTPPEQLEAISIAQMSTIQEVQLVGALDITGSERDFSVFVNDPALGETSFGVHTPTKADLGALAPSGMASVTILESAPWDPTMRSVLISDDEGPLYLADAGFGVDRDGLFGAGFVTWGEPVATVYTPIGGKDSGDYDERGYGPVVFKTDDGAVSILPGAVKMIHVKGAMYRASVIASVQISYHAEEEYACGASSVLSYELVRVSAAPEEIKVIRPAALTEASLGCMGI